MTPSIRTLVHSMLVEVGTQIVAFAEDALLCGGAVVGHLAQQLDVVVAGLGDGAVRVDGAGPVPPVVLVSLTVEGALAGQSDVLLLIGVDQRAPVVQLGAFVVGEHQRVVGRGDVPGEAQDGVLAFQMQVDVALEGDGATSYTPEGMTTVPPPWALVSSMARWMAAVSSLPSLGTRRSPEH